MTWTPKPEYRLTENAVSREDADGLCDWLGFSDQSDIRLPVPWLTQGPLVRQFEETFAKKVGAKHAVFVNSGSSANLLAWYYPRAYDWLVAEEERTFTDPDANIRVVVPAVSWSTSVMPAIQFGYETVLCEADEETWGLDPVDLRRLCESETRGPPAIVLVVHVLGVPAKMQEIDDLRKEFGFLLIEDAGGAFGSQPGGKIADAFTTYEGGFITTNGDDADSASSSGMKLRSFDIVRIARSAPRIPTCTCRPNVLLRQTT
mgnify:CR=1 FL=1